MNKDDYSDHSRWVEFFNQYIVFFNNVTVKQCIQELELELNVRELTESKDDG